MLVDKHFKNLSIVEWKRENLVVLRFGQKIEEGDRLGSSVVDLRFRSGEFMLKVIPMLINLNKLTILSKKMSSYFEESFTFLHH